MFLNFNLFCIILSIKPPLFGEMGAITFGGVAGFSAGFAIKKTLKLIIFICGLLFVIFQILNHYDILVVNWLKIKSLFDYLSNTDYKNLMPILTSHLPLKGGFLVGFTLGLKKG